ncbi:peptide-methionine (S)-S-oxide reductase MsrA [Candidatus Woesearchaeota archaeon]|nr:peptide-methionine (S)-S-oxide reductase MsrA [Candidatus Woesearchaeota archaeon]
MKTEKATFAAGCFWSIQKVFDTLPGVMKTTVGYCGGKTEYLNPSYEQVCSGKTGHAESIEIEFNPKIISYEKLLNLFWEIHDPTTLNRQGPDIGSQYRSAIYYHNLAQKNIAEESKNKAQVKFKKPIVTEITKAKEFYPAEAYHQKYYKIHEVYCNIKIKD